MRKRILATVMALLLSAAMLTGCSGTSRKDYENDVDALIDIYEDLNNGAISIQDAVEDLEVKTPEGKQIKSDMQEMAEIYEKINKYFDRKDYDKIDALEDDLHDLADDTMNHFVDFSDAAEDKDIDEDDLEELEYLFEHLLTQL